MAGVLEGSPTDSQQQDIDFNILPNEWNDSLSRGDPNTSILFEFALRCGSQYNSVRRETDLTMAIKSYKTALEYQPLDQVKDVLVLRTISMLLEIRFGQLSELGDLDAMIACYHQILKLYLPGDSGIYGSLGDLGNAFQTRFNLLENMRDLQRAISCYQQALELCPPGHINYLRILSGLAQALWIRFEQFGEMEDLDRTILYHQQALKICVSEKSADYVGFLGKLAKVVWAQFEKLQKIRDLEEAIGYYQELLDLCPTGCPDHLVSLANVANALQIRFNHLGEMKDLEEAVSLYYCALDMYPPDHPQHLHLLDSLANALQVRFKQLEEMLDLDEALTYHHQALSLCPLGHPNRPTFLNSLAASLTIRFKQLGDIKDLEAAINCHQQALDICAVGHSSHLDNLSNIANSLEIRFKILGEMHNLEEAIGFYYESLKYSSPGHKSYPIILNNLAHALQTQFECLGNVQDLFLATKFYKDALWSLPPDHPFNATIIVAQAQQQIALHQSSWVSCQDCSHCDNACKLLKQAVNHPTLNVYQRFKAAKKWANTAHTFNHPSAITAYSKALLLQKECLVQLPSMTSQQKLMSKSATLGLDAASCAITCGSLNTAVEFLEQGRAIIWSKIQGYKQSIHKISQQDPELATEFETVCGQLEYYARNQSRKDAKLMSDGQVRHQLLLFKRWTKLNDKIRRVEGFSDFMHVLPFKVLKNAVEHGPVIMVNISDFQSDAVILLASSPPIIVPLPDVTSDILKFWAKELKNITNYFSPSNQLVSILRGLWDTIVQPIITQLAKLGVEEKSHIWWCPTSHLCALPLHAAGLYKKGCKNLPDMYISSYTPTLVSLIKARSTHTISQVIPNMLLVSQLDNTIPKVSQETEIIKSFGMQVECYSGRDAHKKAVMAGLKNNNWVHFACHGHLKDQPFHSSLQLDDKEHLTVLDITEAQIPNAEFAFLSACYSATAIPYGTPDEAIHLAAGLQFSGFKSIIGTLWAMVDAIGPTVADIFYQHMFRNPNSVTLRDAAEALNLATKYLRKKGVPLEQWVNFVHIGA
ncbi:CHAT domain-containing protein [Collybia nuda]|uniref:CHAT domain-containing protein n=1 Tax=Collybia nuda TaxID=64659 RepID=A0A9P5YBR2_9AGAR|nr:CHAT domain-containing protein [Collybia nuda]